MHNNSIAGKGECDNDYYKKKSLKMRLKILSLMQLNQLTTRCLQKKKTKKQIEISQQQ